MNKKATSDEAEAITKGPNPAIRSNFQNADPGLAPLVATDASRGTSPTVGPLTINVELPKDSGALRVGPFTPGRVHAVPADEAIRLVTVKGFRYATEADAQLAEGHLAQRNAAAHAHAEVAATADGVDGGTPTASNQE